MSETTVTQFDLVEMDGDKVLKVYGKGLETMESAQTTREQMYEITAEHGNRPKQTATSRIAIVQRVVTTVTTIL